MKARMFFYFSAFFFFCVTAMLVFTRDGMFWPYWVASVVQLIISLPFYIKARAPKNDSYQISEIEVLAKAKKDAENALQDKDPEEIAKKSWNLQ